MTRLALRRTPRLEALENRQVLSVGTTAIEQYALEQLNRARTNPNQVAVDVTSNLGRDTLMTFQFYNVDLSQTRAEIANEKAAAPLAWSDQLASAADRQSNDMATNGFQSHVGSDGSTIEQRLDQAGYTNRSTQGENAFAYSNSVDDAMRAFLVDYGVGDKGHRRTIYNNDFKEVGIAVTSTAKTGIGPEVIVQDFGSRNNEKPFLLGVVYQDTNSDGQYDVGEGSSRLTVSVTPIDANTHQPTGATQDITPWDSGGYQVQLDPGLYRVVAHRGDRVFRAQDVNMGTDNVKIDFNLNNSWDGSTYSTPGAEPVAAAADSAPAAAPIVTKAANVAVAQSAPAPVVATPPVQVQAQPATPKTLAFTWGNMSWRGWNG
ncbi:MAG: CAP domain-containing protein [Isosphaeraceae bacterium]